MNRKLVAVVVAAPLIVGLAIILYTWPSARTQPRDVPVGLVAAPQDVDTQAGRLQAAGTFTVRRYADVAAVTAALRHRDVDAALVTTGTRPQVLLASAAGPALSMAIQPTLRGIAGARAGVIDVVATPTTDPKGSVIGQSVLPLTLAGQLCAIVLALSVRPGWRQLAPLVAVSAATGAIGSLVIDTWLDVTGTGRWWLVAGVLGLTVLAVGSIVLGLHALLGRAGLPVAFASLVFLGNAFSGSSSAPELLPPAVHRIGQWLPPGAGNELLRSVSFFHGHGWVHPTVVLLIWVGFGIVAVAVGRAVADRRAASGRHGRDGGADSPAFRYASE